MSSQVIEQLQRAKQGDQQVLGELLDKHKSYLKVLANLEIGRRLQRKVDASDIVQETYLEAYRHFGEFKGENEQQFSAWLRAILAGRLAKTVRHYLGTQARDLRLEHDVAAGLDQSACSLVQLFADSGSTPSQQMMRGETALQVAEALGKLAPDYQAVLIMRHMEGLKFGQIAERMQRSVDSVEKLWLRGIVRLRETFVGGAP